ncbi:MAG: bifunctional tetrahydrofolate synthase/dihydrofolate synthase [Proteobacteria bacterium]|nr:bifunctional tetrahydrofolate synthase/dihydrofolate synthase [Pseudomonadota bacterium]
MKSLQPNSKLTTKNKLDQWLDRLNQEKIDLGLERCATVYQRLQLEKTSATVITVAGTNGKGSTVAILSALLQALGKSVGSFTSPHLIKYNERICINDQPVSDQNIIDAFEEIKQSSNKTNLSYFEYALLAALINFKRTQVDVILLEVGLGGRLDACNVVNADSTIITSISYDHIDWLGDNLESIGFEKAGIFRAKQQALFADVNCPKSIIKHAKKLGTDLMLFGEDYRFKIQSQGFSFNFAEHNFNSLKTPNLTGNWQLKNASAAIASLLRLGFKLKPKHINQALTTINLPARLQLINKHPAIYLDVAHNLQAASQLAQWLKDNPIKGKTRAVFSVLSDKQFDQWVSCFKGIVDHWFIAELDCPRAMKITDMRQTLADHVGLISIFDDINQAYKMSKQCSKSEDRIIVFGSFYVIAQVLNSNQENLDLPNQSL